MDTKLYFSKVSGKYLQEIPSPSEQIFLLYQLLMFAKYICFSSKSYLVRLKMKTTYQEFLLIINSESGPYRCILYGAYG